MKTKVAEFSDSWKQRFEDIKTRLTNFKNSVNLDFNSIKDIVIKCFESIKNGIKAPINSALGFVEKLVNGIIEAFNGLGDKLGGLEFDLPEWLPGDLSGKHFELNVPKLNTISIPKLAQGAVIPPNKEFLAMLGDQKSGTNIETPLSTMIDAFRQVMREFNGNTGNNNGGSTVIKIVSPDNVTLAQAVVEGGKVIQMSSGNNIFELAGG